MKIKNIASLLMAAGLITGCVFPDPYHRPSPSIQSSVPVQPQSTSSLPYGLQKKLQRGQSLPPGWQKKLRPGRVLDAGIYSHGDIVVPLDSHGLVTIRVEGKFNQAIPGDQGNSRYIELTGLGQKGIYLSKLRSLRLKMLLLFQHTCLPWQ